MNIEEPDCRGTALVIALCLIGLLVTIAFGAWAYFREVRPPVVTHLMDEGEAKAIMIQELTGLELSPEVAKWAEVKFSGSTVSIDTHTINLWDGKKWRELER